VVTGEKNLDDRSEKEEEDGEDGDGEARCVQAANIAPVTSTRSVLATEASSERSVDNALAFAGAMAGVVCDCGKAAREQNVEQDSDESEESDATQAEGEEDTEDGVQDGSARHAFNGLLPYWNVNVLVGQDGEEVAVDAENNGSASEFEETQASLAEA